MKAKSLDHSLSSSQDGPMKTAGEPATYLQGPRVWIFLAMLFLVSALCQMDRMLPFILAEPIKRELGLSDTQIGVIAGLAFAVCFSLLSLPLARAADAGSPKRILVFCIAVWSAMTFMGGMAASMTVLALSRFGVALGESGATPSSHAIIAREIAPERRGIALGIFSMGIPLGTMLGFGLGGRISDTLGWRAAFFGAGAVGLLLASAAAFVFRPTAPIVRSEAQAEPFFASSRRLLAKPAFLWLLIGSVILGFAAAPFYAFATPFLIRIHGFTASEAGLAFGLPQGLMGVLGAILAGRGFDRAVQAGRGDLLRVPAIVFLIASFTTLAGLFAPVGWMAVALFVPGMFSFAFLLPYAFGSGHLVAGEGNQAVASSLAMIGSGLLGPALGPLIAGMVSDAVTAAQAPDGLRWGMLIVPAASLASGVAMLVANRRVAEMLGRR